MRESRARQPLLPPSVLCLLEAKGRKNRKRRVFLRSDKRSAGQGGLCSREKGRFQGYTIGQGQKFVFIISVEPGELRCAFVGATACSNERPCRGKRPRRFRAPRRAALSTTTVIMSPSRSGEILKSSTFLPRSLKRSSTHTIASSRIDAKRTATSDETGKHS